MSSSSSSSRHHRTSTRMSSTQSRDVANYQPDPDRIDLHGGGGGGDHSHGNSVRHSSRNGGSLHKSTSSASPSASASTRSPLPSASHHGVLGRTNSTSVLSVTGSSRDSHRDSHRDSSHRGENSHSRGEHSSHRDSGASTPLMDSPTTSIGSNGGSGGHSGGGHLERNGSGGSGRPKPRRTATSASILERTLSGDRGSSTPPRSPPAHKSGGRIFDMRAMAQEVMRSEQQGPPNSAPATPGVELANNGSVAAPDPPPKRSYKTKSLWGKMAKSGGAAKTQSTPDATAKKNKWDQVLNPLIKTSSAPSSAGRHSSRNEQREAVAYYAAQQQQVAAAAAVAATSGINYMNAPNQSTTQCDCGDDSCPFCNLLLNMEMTDPNMLM
jgi:hypothetical protein